MIHAPNPVYRPVPGYDELYAGTDGTIMHGGKGKLEPRVNNGYLRVYIPKVGKRKVHQLVAETFLGPRSTGMETRHSDGNKLNNNLMNLCYGTRKDNAQDCILHGSLFNTKKSHCPKGHPYDEKNTYISPDGKSRQCNKCRAFQVKKYDSKPENRSKRSEYNKNRNKGGQ